MTGSHCLLTPLMRANRRNGWLEAVLLPPGGASGFTEAEEYGLVLLPVPS